MMSKKSMLEVPAALSLTRAIWQRAPITEFMPYTYVFLSILAYVANYEVR